MIYYTKWEISSYLLQDHAFLMHFMTFCLQWLYARIATDLPIYREHCNVQRIPIFCPIRELGLPARNIAYVLIL